MLQKFALVTGNNIGIGQAITKFLQENGYQVPMLIRSNDYDLREPQACQRLSLDFIQQYGSIDLLVNNVGNYETGYIDEFTQEQWFEVFRSNADSMFFMTKFLLPELRKSKGKIINLGFCGLQKLSSPPDHFAYQAAKTVSLVLTKSLAKQEASNQVTINMISPGSMENTVETDDCLKRIPMNRLGRFEELCQIVKLIIENDYLTGQNIELAGARAL